MKKGKRTSHFDEQMPQKIWEELLEALVKKYSSPTTRKAGGVPRTLPNEGIEVCFCGVSTKKQNALALVAAAFLK